MVPGKWKISNTLTIQNLASCKLLNQTVPVSWIAYHLEEFQCPVVSGTLQDDMLYEAKLVVFTNQNFCG